MRPDRTPRLRALGCAVLTAAALAAAGLPGPVSAEPRPAESSASLKEQVAALDAEIERVAVQLAEGATAYDAAEDALARLTQEQFAARADREELLAAEADSRGALSGLARAAYKGGMPPMVTALLSGEPRAVSHLAYVQRSVNRLGATHSDVARDLAQQQAGAGAALIRSDELRRKALAQQQELEEQRRAMSERTARLTADLQAAGTRLLQVHAAEQAAEAAKAAARAEAKAQADAERAAVAARQRAVAAAGAGSPAGSGAGSCQPPSSAGEVNGFLSVASLCPLSVGAGHRLRSDAAQAFEALNRARLASAGVPLCVTDSYRSYPAQVDVFRRKPNLAATPGRSQHGWGLAVDFCGGVQSFGTEAHAWMRANAGAFGWIHPDWAGPRGSRPEPWHWEYVG
ncbi:MAG: M15 family metallopeptidase [Mycobacteriales bacterium]